MSYDHKETISERLDELDFKIQASFEYIQALKDSIITQDEIIGSLINKIANLIYRNELKEE